MFGKLNKVAIAVVLAGVLASCQESVTRNEGARILSVGDSLMAWNSLSGNSIPQIVEKELKESVVDRSFSGARMLIRGSEEESGNLSIPQQYEAGEWDWVIMNGGGNDLMFGCGCIACDGTLNRMISEDGMSGAIPDLVRQVHEDGAQVLYFGYLRSPKLITPIEHCKDEGDELDARLTKLASQQPGIVFVPMSDVVPPGGLSYFSPDLIHPSRKTSRLVGKRLAGVIELYDGR